MTFLFQLDEKGRGYYLYSPYDPDFVNDLKAAVDSSERRWFGDKKAWWVDKLAFDEAKRVCLDYGRVVIRNEKASGPTQEQQEEERQQRQADEERRQRAEQDVRDRFRREEEERQRRIRYGSAQPADSYAVLHLTRDAPVEVVAAAWRALCLLHHPDKGGSVERMQEINVAYDQIKKERGQK